MTSENEEIEIVADGGKKRTKTTGAKEGKVNVLQVVRKIDTIIDDRD